jgi:tetratricopeptide (TPR) repeat protein
MSDPGAQLRWAAAMALVSLGMGLGLGACTSARPRGPYEAPSEAQRDSARAELLTREAAELLTSEPERAETLLREALSADLYCGPAHNNLGVVFLAQGKRYDAAQEFEWAKKLLPGHPDPRVNLALCFEDAGRLDEALEHYASALEVYPGYVPAMQGAASLALRSGKPDPRLRGWLDEIALRGETPDWQHWASARAARGAATEAAGAPR